MFDLYLRYEYWFAAAQLTFAMLGMGATLRLTDFLDVFRQPKAFAAGMIVQVAGVPLLAATLNGILSPAAGIAAGLVLVSAVPGGAMSNLFTFLARGNVALSIALTGVTTLACLFTTPVVLSLLAGDYIGREVTMPAGRIALDIVLFLLLPLALGMIAGAQMPELRGRFTVWCIRASLFVILLIIIGSAGAGRIDPRMYGWEGVLLILLLAVLVQQLAVLPAWLLGLTRRDGIALAIETTVRNTNLGLLIKASVFPAVPGVLDPVGDGVLFVTLLYGGIALPVALPVILAGRRLA
jgi:BASS family bile acid:Na+ symporter